jgi:hypothetical protein
MGSTSHDGPVRPNRKSPVNVSVECEVFLIGGPFNHYAIPVDPITYSSLKFTMTDPNNDRILHIYRRSTYRLGISNVPVFYHARRFKRYDVIEPIDTLVSRLLYRED